jgi:hypothetical protein
MRESGTSTPISGGKTDEWVKWHSAQESTSYGEKVARTKIPTTPQKSGNE